MTLSRLEDPLKGAGEALRAFMATQPKIDRPWTLPMIVTGCANPYNTRRAEQPLKKSYETDVSTGERVSTIHPEQQQRCQSIVRSLRASGWSFEGIYTLVFHFKPKGTQWLLDQWNPDFVFVRSWEQAGKDLPRLQKKTSGEYHVNEFIVAHVWAYIRRNPGKGVKEMRADWTNLLPGLRGRTRLGAIDRAREALEADGRIVIRVGKFGKKFHYSVVDEDTGEIIEHPETSDELDRLVPVALSARRVPLCKLSVVT